MMLRYTVLQARPRSWIASLQTQDLAKLNLHQAKRAAFYGAHKLGCPQTGCRGGMLGLEGSHCTLPAGSGGESSSAAAQPLPTYNISDEAASVLQK